MKKGIANIKQALLETGIAKPSSIRGCTDGETDESEDIAGFSLPNEYRDIMKIIGKESGLLLADSVFHYPAVKTLTATLIDDLSAFVRLPKRVFFFYCNLGEIALYYSCDDKSGKVTLCKWTEENDSEYVEISKGLTDIIFDEISHLTVV